MNHVPIQRVELIRDGTAKYEAESKRIASVADVNLLVGPLLARKTREYLMVIYLNARKAVVGMETISIGILTASLAHPREIFQGAILANAASIIMAHNHPSGDPAPSEEDIRLTKRIQQAGLILGIWLDDHVIYGADTQYSFRTSGALS